jgi:hypothetical protein
MNPWEKYGGGNATVSTETAPNIIKGRPKPIDPYKERDQQLQENAAQRSQRSLDIQEQRFAIDAEKERLAIEKERKEQNEAGQAKLNTAASVRKTIAELKQIRQDTEGDFFETGTSGNIARAIPLVSNDAKGLEARLEGIKGLNAFAALQELASQGVKLTPISNAEIDLAARSIANLDPSQNEEVFLGQLDKATSFYQDLLNKLERETGQQNTSQDHPDVVGGVNTPETFNGIPRGTDTQQGGNGNDLRSRVLKEKFNATPNQAALITAFWNANRNNDGLTVEAVRDYYRKNGLPHTSDAEIQASIEDARNGLEFSPFDTSVEEERYRQEISRRANEREEANEAGFGEKAQSGLLLGFDDEIAGVGGGIGSVLSGEGFGEGYTRQRDVRREINRRADERTGVAGDVVEIGSGLLLPVGVGGQSVKQAAKVGGGVGAAGGFGYGEGLEGSATNALLGGAAGGVLGGVGQKASNALINKFAASRATNQSAPRNSLLQNKEAIARQEVAENIDVIRAGQAENIPVRQPDVRPSTRDRFGALEASESSGPKIQQTLANDNKAIEARLSEIGGKGTPKDGYSLGESVQGAVRAEKDKLTNEAGALYRRVELQAPNFKASPKGISRVVDDRINSIKEITPNGSGGEIKLLNTIKENFNKTGVTLESIQANRAIIQKGIKDDNLSFTKKEVELLEIMNAANNQFAQELSDSGNSAALQTLNRANAKWREVADFKKNVVKKLVGNNQNELFSEQTADRLIKMVSRGGDSDKAVRVYKSLPAADKADFKALIAQNLGANHKGEFSIAALAKNLSDKKTNKKALREIFGSDDYQSLMNLKKLSEAKLESSVRFNRSNTARAQNNGSNFKRFVTGGIGLSVGDATGAVAGYVGPTLVERIGAKRATKLLLDPDFSKWLVNMPETSNPKAIDAYVGRLDRMFPKGSAQAANVLDFQSFLLEAAKQSPSRVAASDDENNGGVKPPQ